MSLLNHLRYRLKKNKGEGLVHDNKNKLLSFNNFGKGCHGLLDSNIFSRPLKMFYLLVFSNLINKSL